MVNANGKVLQPTDLTENFQYRNEIEQSEHKRQYVTETDTRITPEITEEFLHHHQSPLNMRLQSQNNASISNNRFRRESKIQWGPKKPKIIKNVRIHTNNGVVIIEE